MEGYDRTSYGEGFADVYDDWYADVSPPEATAAFVAARTAGPVLELGSGTGRLAGPLARRGVAVVGIDASPAMLSRSRRAHPDVAVALADMREPPLRPRSVGAVLVAFNTLFNLDRAGQLRALRRCAEVVLAQGLVIVEAFVPDPSAPTSGDRVEVVRLDADVVVLRVSSTGRDATAGDEPGSGVVSGQHIELRDGDPVRLRPWRVTFRSPTSLDATAAEAGLELVERHGGWDGEPFDAASTVHVSVYRPRHRHR